MKYTSHSPEMIAASHLLHYYNTQGGYPGGSFATKLIELMEIADEENLQKLLTVYPEYEFGVRMLQKSGKNKLATLVLSARYGMLS